MPTARSLSAARLFASLLVVFGLLASPVHAQVVISQVYGGGGNTGATLTHDFIELLNTGTQPVTLNGWSVQYASSAGSSWSVTTLSGTLQPGQYYLIQQAAGTGGTTPLPTADKVGTIAMSGTSAKVALVNGTGALTGTCPAESAFVDFVGYGTSANCSLGAPTATLTNTTAAVRLENGCKDTRNNNADFAREAPVPRNTSSPLNSCGNVAQPTAPTIGASASPASLLVGESTLLTATVTPGANPVSSGLSVTADLSAIGGTANQTLFDDGSHGDAVAGDLVFSYRATLPGNLSGGVKTLSFTVSDAEERSASADASVSVVVLVPIAAIQGNAQVSPLVGATVVTEGVVTGVRINGFYIQTPDHLTDNDPQSSEGILVFTGSGNVPAAAVVGNLVRVQAKVTEFLPTGSALPLTELTSPVTASVLATGQALPQPVQLSAADLAAGANADALERFEGMRVSATKLHVVAPTLGFINERNATSSGNGIFYAVLDGVPRPFREPGIEPSSTLAVPANTPRFDGNHERLRIDSRGLGGTPLTVDAGTEVNNLVGVLDYAFSTWSILPQAVNGLELGAGPLPRPSIRPAAEEFSVAAFNLLRLFDDVNDPTIGEPVLTPEAYAFRLAKTANSICHYLHAPDILGVVEVESLAVLSRLADEINASCDKAPAYVAYLEEGNDVGGIDVGFLISRRQVAPGLPRVDVDSVVQIGKDATWIQPSGSPALLNDRPSLAIEATVNHSNGQRFALTVVANHLRSLSGANEDSANGDRVRRKRAAQATMLAEWVEQRQQADAERPIILLGDFNAFEFNDGLTDVMGIISGQPAAANEVLVHAPSPVTRALRNLTLDEPAGERYSFSFDGNAQTLDHLLVNQALLAKATVVADHARLNADFSEVHFGNASNDARVSDHDPVLAVVSVPQFFSADLAVSVLGPKNPIIAGRGDDFGVSVSNSGPHAASAAKLRLDASAPASALRITAPAGWQCAVTSSTSQASVFECQFAGGFANAARGDFVIFADPPRHSPQTVFELRATVSSLSYDGVLNNNVGSASQKVTGKPSW